MKQLHLKGIKPPKPLKPIEAYTALAKAVSVIFVETEAESYWAMEAKGKLYRCKGSRMGLSKRPSFKGFEGAVLRQAMPSLVGRAILDSRAVAIRHFEGREFELQCFGMFGEGPWVRCKYTIDGQFISWAGMPAVGKS